MHSVERQSRRRVCGRAHLVVDGGAETCRSPPFAQQLRDLLLAEPTRRHCRPRCAGEERHGDSVECQAWFRRHNRKEGRGHVPGGASVSASSCWAGAPNGLKRTLKSTAPGMLSWPPTWSASSPMLLATASRGEQ